MKHAYKLLLLFIIMSQLSGCSIFFKGEKDGPPKNSVDINKIPNAIPKVEQRSKYGNPPSYVVNGKRYTVLKTAKDYNKIGYASWYGTKFHNRLTSSREPYDMFAMTGASRELPLPTYVRVTDLENGRSIIVRINDRGPFKQDRIIDLTYVAAKKLGFASKGTALVRVTAIDPRTWRTQPIYNPPIPEYHLPAVYLQVAALSNQPNARRMSQRLSALTGQKVKIQPIKKDGQIIYQVQVGPLVGAHVYDRTREILTAHGISKPILIPAA